MNRNDLIKNAAEHYSGLKDRNGLREVDVPEWGGKLHYPSTIPLLRRDRVVKLHAGGGLKHMAQIIIECARDESGKALLKSQDMDILLRDWDPDVLMRVAGEMVSALVPPTEDEIEKNYAATETLGTDASSPIN